jgi:hypothetical protein
MAAIAQRSRIIALFNSDFRATPTRVFRPGMISPEMRTTGGFRA